MSTYWFLGFLWLLTPSVLLIWFATADDHVAISGWERLWIALNGAFVLLLGPLLPVAMLVWIGFRAMRQPRAAEQVQDCS